MIRGKWFQHGFAGVYLLEPFSHSDVRGDFVKTFHIGQVKDAELNFELREEFYSISHKNVLRGMHFQMPPHSHQKIVSCLAGAVLDVLVDLRKSEPTFGKALSFELSATNRRVLWIPVGVAHGFLSLCDKSFVIYKTDKQHFPEFDQGVHWDSFGFKWPTTESSFLISSRDSNHPRFDQFESPF